ATTSGQTFVIIVTDQDYSQHKDPNGNPQPLDNLKGTGRDGQNVSDFFVECGVPKANITVLGDSSSHSPPLTGQTVLDAISNVHAGPNDTVFVYYSGHGDSSSENGAWILNGGNVTADQLATALDGTGAGQKIVISDSCHSGAFVSRLTS